MSIRSLINHRLLSSLMPVLVLMLAASAASAQGTTFTYQGRLTDTGMPASNIYEMEFRLFDSLAGGTQQGATITNSAVQVTNGVFTLQLDFGDQFDGNSRYLEIAIRPLGSPDPFVVLTPRQPVMCSPYAIKSAKAASADTAADATQLGGMPASGFIQNTTTEQSATNFNVSGTGTAGVFNAATQYNLGGSRVLSAGGTANLFAGVNAGAANTGVTNAFFGANAGQSNTAGGLNSFFGGYAGASNTTGLNNSFFGAFAGGNTTIGSNNSFFGRYTGLANTTGSGNTFVGSDAGLGNTTGYENSLFGWRAGNFNTTGVYNSFFGADAGQYNTTGNGNSFFGWRAGNENSTGIGNSFFGNTAGRYNTSGSNNSFFGGSAGSGNTTGGGNSFFGTSAGQSNATGASNSFFGIGAGNSSSSGSNNSFFGSWAGYSHTTGNYNTFVGASATGTGITNATALGAYAQVTLSNSLVLGSINGVNGATADTNVGIGTTAPTSRLDVVGDINTTTQYNIGGNRAFSVAGTQNVFAGLNAGTNNTANGNSFFGAQAGQSNSSGNVNSFFGERAGLSNTFGFSNSFFGRGAGQANTEGFDNSFFGSGAGWNTTTGRGNSFFGQSTGASNTTENFNTFIGSFSNGSAGTSHATAIGYAAQVTQSNSLVLGSIAGVNGAETTVNVGIGTTAPADRLHVNGIIRVDVLGAAGVTTLCRNGSNQISSCSSSLRYKEQVTPFLAGLEVVNRLRPTTFNWKQSGERDLGLVAEEVAAVEPLLVTYNDKGQVEGVKYDRINVLLVNAVKQQQQQITQLQKQLHEQGQQQQTQIDALKRLVCKDNPQAEACK